MSTTTTPQERLNVKSHAREAYRALLDLDRAVHSAGIDPLLAELVKLRASQLNGCAYCADMHSVDAIAAGEHPRRLYAVAAWRESPFFSPAERAAFGLTEAATRLTDGPVDDDVWAEAAEHFDENELANLLMLIATINAWNRLGVTAQLQPPPLENE